MNNSDDLKQYHNSIQSIYNNSVDAINFSLDSLIFNSLDKQSILENGFYKKGIFKEHVLNKFLKESSNRLMFNMFYPLMRTFNRKFALSIHNVEFDQVHFEWNHQKFSNSPIDILLISSKSKVLYFLECKFHEPNNGDYFQFSESYLNQLKTKGLDSIHNLLIPYIKKYESLNENNQLIYGAGISQNLRQIMSILANKGTFRISNKKHQYTNYILDINPDFNNFDIWFGNLLFYDNHDNNQAAKYFDENCEFVNDMKDDLLQSGITIKHPITYKTIFYKNKEKTYDLIKRSFTLSDYLEHNYFNNIK